MVVTGPGVGDFSLSRLADRPRAPVESFWQAIEEVLNAVLLVVISLYVAIVPTTGLVRFFAADKLRSLLRQHSGPR